MADDVALCRGSAPVLAYNRAVPEPQLLAVIPLVALGVAFAFFVGMPAAIRRGFWVRPRFEALGIDEAIVELNRPELAEADRRFDELSEQLGQLGYRETDRFVAPEFASRCLVAILLMHDSRDDTIAGVQLVWHGDASDRRLQLRGEYYGFVSCYDAPNAATGTLTVQTSTSPQLFPMPRDTQFLCVDWLRDPAEVHELHRRHCDQARPRESRPAVSTDDARDGLLRRHARTLARAVEVGYLHPERPGLLRLTRRGALHVTTQLIWPIAPAVKARQRLATRRQIAAWR